MGAISSPQNSMKYIVIGMTGEGMQTVGGSEGDADGVMDLIAMGGRWDWTTNGLENEAEW